MWHPVLKTMEPLLVPLRPIASEPYFRPHSAQVTALADSVDVSEKSHASLRQTHFGVSPTESLNTAPSYSADHPKFQIFHPSQAPSAQITENLLMARALMAPAYAHSGAASKMARVSNMFQDLPRFGSAINILS